MISKSCHTCGISFQAKCALSRYCSLACNVRRYIPVGDPDGCLNWTGPRNAHGYGILNKWKAHRAMWTVERGPIPDGLCVLHACNNTSCVNIRHLKLGTPLENAADRAACGHDYDRHGERNPRVRTTAKEIEAARVRYAAGETYASIARDVGVSMSGLYSALIGRTWKRAGGPIHRPGATAR